MSSLGSESRIRRLISGLSSLSETYPSLQVEAAHDIIIVGPLKLEGIDPQLYNILCDLGWHYSQEHEGMAFFT